MRKRVQKICPSTPSPCPASLFQLPLSGTAAGPNPSRGLPAEDHWLLQEHRRFALPRPIRRSTSETCPNGGQGQKAGGQPIRLAQTKPLLAHPGRSSAATSSEQLSPEKGWPRPSAEPAVPCHGDRQAKITDVTGDLLHFGVCFSVLFLNKGSSLSDTASSLQLV